MTATLKNPDAMSLDEFLVWDVPEGALWQLVDGEPRAMAPTSPIRGVIQSRLAGWLANHLDSQGGRCLALTNPGVRLGVRADSNYRIPDVAVTCSDLIAGESMIQDPVLLVEILSPSNPADTWMNVWAYTTIPSVQEILVVRSTTIGAHLLRRNPDGHLA